jgi:hypothetical protein
MLNAFSAIPIDAAASTLLLAAIVLAVIQFLSWMQ